MSKNRTAQKNQKSINSIKDRTKGIIFILLAAFFFSAMSVFVRLSEDVPTMQKAFFRNIVAAVVAVIILLRSGGPVTVRKKSLPALFLRSAFGTVGILANFWAVDHLDIADANMLNKLSPFFAILMSIFILQEMPSRIEWLSVLLRNCVCPCTGWDSGRIHCGHSLHICAQTGTAGSEGTYSCGLFLNFLHTCAAAQPVDQLHAHEREAVYFPDSGGLRRRRRTALSHSSLSACSRAGYLRV